MKQRSAVAVVALAAVAALFAAALLSGDRSLERLREKGVIRIGYAVEAPYAFLTPGGEVTGESPEVARQVVSRLGIERVEWRQEEFHSLISELRANRIDVIAAGMFITPERSRQVGFSEPTFQARPGLLVAKGNPRQIHSYSQLAAGGSLKAAVLSGSVEEQLLLRMKMPKSRLLIVPDALTGKVAVESGVADGLALSSPTIQWMAMQDRLGKVEAVGPLEEPATAGETRPEYGGFAFRPQDKQLLDGWNEALKAFIGSPEHLGLVAPFGFSRGDIPAKITTKEIISR